MRQLTFPGFLGRYVRALSGSNTSSLYSLTREAVHENPRLREPLYLYALSTGRVNTLLKASRYTDLGKEYEYMYQRYSYADLLSELQKVPCSIPEGYQKVWRSYQSETDVYERDTRVKELIRARVLECQQEKGISTYRICQDLHLNNSNINAWLKNNSPAKVSLSTARRILSYLGQ